MKPYPANANAIAPTRLARVSTLIATVAAAAGLAGASVPALDAAGQARLANHRQAPAAAGDLIYRGAVFEQGGAAASPLFTYERRVGRSAEGLTMAAHVTRTAVGEVVIAEEAHFAPGYSLRRFEAANAQLGYSGSVVVSEDGRHLEYRLVQNGRVTTATEDVHAPVVSGPSLHGFILQRWDELVPGRSLPVRFIVMAEKQTYGFVIRRVRPQDGNPAHSSFSIAPSSWFVRLALKPLTVTFDNATRNVVRYEGRVPPMRELEGRLKPLDARVDYTTMHTGYR